MDFGLGGSFAARGSPTGALLGTLAYVAPEIIEGAGSRRRAATSTRWASSLYEVLAGGACRSRPTPPSRCCCKHCTEDPGAPSAVRSEVPPGLDAHGAPPAAQEARADRYADRGGAAGRAAGVPEPGGLTYRCSTACPRWRARVPAGRGRERLGAGRHRLHPHRLGSAGGRDGERVHRDLRRRQRGVLESGRPGSTPQARAFAGHHHRRPAHERAGVPHARRPVHLHAGSHLVPSAISTSPASPCRSGSSESRSPCREVGVACTRSTTGKMPRRSASRSAPRAPATRIASNTDLGGDVDLISVAGAVKLTPRLALGASYNVWRGDWTEDAAVSEMPVSGAKSRLRDDPPGEPHPRRQLQCGPAAQLPALERGAPSPEPAALRLQQ